MKIPEHISKLKKYVLQESERNEDLVLSYFRHIFPDNFVRQSDAENSDGYVPGHLVLEIKGDTNDWFAGLFQGLSYESRGLAFSLIVVIAKEFIAVWNKDDLPNDVREAILSEKAAPNEVGKKYARKYASKRNAFLKLSCWHRPEIFKSLFAADSDVWIGAIKNFEKTLYEKKKVRQQVSTKNFVTKLQEMKEFFDPAHPIKAVRAFYSMIYGPWDEQSSVQLNLKHDDRATLGGSEITNLISSKRMKFKEFIENHYICLKDNENLDDFFSRYDEALDVVDKDFRIKNGIFFTDLDLSKFVMWLVKKKIPELGKNYLVIDPACGSGNLVTNWKSPLELRHKVVSEIEPELLFAVEQRMKGDQWHNGKFTVVPKVSENMGLNFLDKSASEYLDILRRYLEEKGHKPNKPLAFLCNPPYRSDDDQSADSVSYKIDKNIVDLVGTDAASERYCCFLAQMKLICQSAEENGFPEESILMLFTKAAWLTKRPVFEQIRRTMLGSFEDVGGVLVNGREFFDLKGKFPIAFTIWRYKGAHAALNTERSIPLTDLTHLTKSDLQSVNWENPAEVEISCNSIVGAKNIKQVEIGAIRVAIQAWTGQKMLDFKRGRRLAEIGQRITGGLPKGDARHGNKKAYGEGTGRFIGFMDDLTPCRTEKNPFPDSPWFRLNSPFMDCRKTRLFSGPTDQKAFSSADPIVLEKLFFWYALGRTFSVFPYPMWADADEMWAPNLVGEFQPLITNLAYAIAFSENECVETVFPAHNPVAAAPEIHVSNPMTPLSPDSYWSRNLKLRTANSVGTAGELLKLTNSIFLKWKNELKLKKDLPLEGEHSYFVSDGSLRIGAGLIQIKDYAIQNDKFEILEEFRKLSVVNKKAKEEFFQILTSTDGVNYFGATKSDQKLQKPVPFAVKTKFDTVIERRLALSAYIIDTLQPDKNFGITKFVKLLYLADRSTNLDLKTEYFRQAAGPLDPRAIYNPKVGILPLAQRHGYFELDKSSKLHRFILRNNFVALKKKADDILKNEKKQIDYLIKLFAALDTDQAEIIATLHACWNDLLNEEKNVSDDLLVRELLDKWHKKKKQFPVNRLKKAITWMREHKLIPNGDLPKTQVKFEEASLPEWLQ